MARQAATRPLSFLVALACASAALAGDPASSQASDSGEAHPGLLELRWGLEGRVHARNSERLRIPVSFSFDPSEQASAGLALETVSPGSHLEVSALTLTLDAALGPSLAARAKIDLIDLYDRNPSSTDKKVDVDELWLRFGREAETATLPERPGAYLKAGKLPKFERQDDRHLESYGLVATAFNRFEDVGLELGADLGRRVYVKASATQGNPVFLRDPNALAGDQGTPELLSPDPDPALATGIPILYDTEVEDVDVDGDLELGLGVGARFAEPAGAWGVEVLAWGYRRELAESVDIEGSFYGGDLDLLRGPFDRFPFPISGADKRESGANLWAYRAGTSLFLQAVDQELAGLGRTGFEVEGAWRLELPLRWALAGRQLFPAIAPALRYSRLDHDFRSPVATPSPSFSWDWQKWDAGVRLTILSGADLTVELADNEFVLGSGRRLRLQEVLATLRWRARGALPTG